MDEIQEENKRPNSIGIYCSPWSGWLTTNFNISKNIAETENNCPTDPCTSNIVEPLPIKVSDAVAFEDDTNNDPVITASPLNGKALTFVKFEPSPTK